MISFFCEEVPYPSINLDRVTMWIENTVTDNNLVASDISIIFCNDSYLLNMNQTYLKHNYFTDIITFDYSDAAYISGDLFISLDRVYDNAKLFCVSFEQELLRVVIHGILHLLGFNDKLEEEQKTMKSLENYYLNLYQND